HGRTVMGILLLSGALLFMPNTAHAQSELRPGSTPIETTPALIVSRELSLAETPSAEIIHVIEVGDNLTNVASRYNVETGALAAYNQILDFNHVMLGQKLRIPPVEVATANLLLEDEIVAEATGAEAVV